MYECYFTFRSITAAQRAERILLERGIRSKLLRSPKFLSIKGCGYALRIQNRDAITAATLLAAAQVNYSAVYRIGPDGRGEELPL